MTWLKNLRFTNPWNGDMVSIDLLNTDHISYINSRRDPIAGVLLYEIVINGRKKYLTEESYQIVMKVLGYDDSHEKQGL